MVTGYAEPQMADSASINVHTPRKNIPEVNKPVEPTGPAMKQRSTIIHT